MHWSSTSSENMEMMKRGTLPSRWHSLKQGAVQYTLNLLKVNFRLDEQGFTSYSDFLRPPEQGTQKSWESFVLEVFVPVSLLGWSIL